MKIKLESSLGSMKMRIYLCTVGVKVDGWDGCWEGVHFPLVGSNLVLQSTECLEKKGLHSGVG